jgi:heme-degrading monooxygenase HmoA
MFIAMNRFKVALGREAEFEDMWAKRESHLPKRPGFVAFHLLKGPTRADHTLFSSHTTWADRRHFEDWTVSEEFTLAHRNAHRSAGFMVGPAEFEGFDVSLSILAPGADPRAEGEAA